MKYSWEFKLKCIENYKRGIRTAVPENCNISQKDYAKRVRLWVRLFDIHGIEVLKHKTENKVWSAEEKYDLVAKVMAGNSISSIAIEAGINPGQLYTWINKVKQLGYDGLQWTKRRRLSKEEGSVVNNDNSPKELSKSEKEELIALRRRNEYLEAENAYLKKIKALAIQKAASVKAKKQPSSKALPKKDIE